MRRPTRFSGLKMPSSIPSEPFLGHGVGLRVPHYARALNHQLDVDWVELISENFFGRGGRPRAILETVCSDLPVVLHGVSMAIGSVDGVDEAYLDQLATVVDIAQPRWVSDHLCWSRFGNAHSHDLLPLPYTPEALEVVVRNVEQVQQRLGRTIALENVSSYVAFDSSEMPEWEFLAEVARRSGCNILLDVNNIVVSAKNFEFDPLDYLAGIPASKVVQIHLANHTDRGHYKFDSHRGAVPPEVWSLYEAAIRRFGPIPSLVEWDDEVPTWDVLRAEQREAARRCEQAAIQTPAAQEPA